MPLNTPQRSRTGFTLVEIMVSLVLLSLMASGVFSIFVSARYLVARSKSRVLAMEAAQNKIEQMRINITAATWDQSGGPLEPTAAWSARDAVTYAPYSVRYRVDPAPGAEYRKVTVEVAWNETRV